MEHKRIVAIRGRLARAVDHRRTTVQGHGLQITTNGAGHAVGHCPAPRGENISRATVRIPILLAVKQSCSALNRQARSWLVVHEFPGRSHSLQTQERSVVLPKALRPGARCKNEQHDNRKEPPHKRTPTANKSNTAAAYASILGWSTKGIKSASTPHGQTHHRHSDRDDVDRCDGRGRRRRACDRAVPRRAAARATAVSLPANSALPNVRSWHWAEGFGAAAIPSCYTVTNPVPTSPLAWVLVTRSRRSCETGSYFQPRACRQLSHMTTQTSRTPARNVLASLSKRVAMAR